MIKRRIAFSTVCLLVVAASGCKKDQAQKAASPPPAAESNTLAGRLNGMKPEAQIDTLRALVAADTNDAQLRFLSGNAYYSYAVGLENAAPSHAAYLDSAIAEYKHAAKADSSASKVWVNLGLAYQEHGQPTQARTALDQAIKVNPNDVLAYCHLGYLAHARGDMTEAMRQYNLALAIDPNSPQAHYNIGLAFAEAKIFNEALREWNLVIKNDPNGDLGKTAAENVKIIEQYQKQ